MLRTLSRTVVILVLAATVAGALYAAVASRGTSLSGERPGERRLASAPDDSEHGRDGADGRVPHRGERHGRQEASLGHGLAGSLGTALQVGCVGALVVWLQKRRRRR